MKWSQGKLLNRGKYRIEQELGEGGFGITYLALNLNTLNGEKVVIKTLNERMQKEPDFDKMQQDFLKEAERLKKCQHPHIVKFYEVIKEGNLDCIVMEYI
ncbi:MAG TPA: protein kinase, partial [Allocoleopsis sp.]